VRSTGVGVPRSAAPGDAALAPGSSSATDLEVFGLYLSGSPSFPPPPINWRLVGDEAECACSQVAAAERLLYETLASVHQNILHLIRVSLKRKNLAHIPLASFALSHPSYVLFPRLLS
jgi:hypothetical protein